STPSRFAFLQQVKVSKDDSIILDGAGARDGIEERCSLLRESIARVKSDYEKEKLSERLAKLHSGVAVIKVGGSSEVEVGEKKDRFVDALNATRAAVSEGIVPGGGSALLWASRQLEATKASCANMDQKIGVEIIEKALRMPVHTIAMNAGVEGAVVVGELLKTEDPQWGHNAATGEYCDMIQAGIIDPTKVVRTALVDAQSVAALLMTAEAMVTDLPEEEAPAPPMGGGGMGGGMGGMGGMPGMM
ncbi:unnamed protein product, partial [Ectocarpus fasciculatus]